jgi:hypothetical protein
MPLLANHEIAAGSILCASNTAALLTNAQTSGDMIATCVNNTDMNFIRPSDVATNLKLSITQAGTISSSWRLEWAISQPLHEVRALQMPVYFSTDAPGSLGNLLFISNSGAFANQYNYGPWTIAPNVCRKGWNLVTLDINKPTGSGGAPTRTMTVTNLRMNITIPAGYVGDFYFCPIYKNKYNRPKVCIGFDDALAPSAWTDGASYMLARGVKGYWCPPTAQLDTTGVTTAQLQTLHAAGWSIHNQTVSDTVLTGLTSTQVKGIVSQAQATLNDKGLTYGSRTICYPTGAVDDTVIQAVSELGYSGGGIVRQQVESHWDGVSQPMRLNRTNINVSTLGQMTALIDQAVDLGGYIVFFVHDLVGTPSAATFQGVVDYALRLRESNVLDIVSLQALLDELQRPRRQR